jgi:hypothetical protein
MKTVNRLSVEHKGRWLALCMFVCLLLLSACQTAEVPPVPAQPAVEDPEKQEEATLRMNGKKLRRAPWLCS